MFFLPAAVGRPVSLKIADRCGHTPRSPVWPPSAIHLRLFTLQVQRHPGLNVPCQAFGMRTGAVPVLRPPGAVLFAGCCNPAAGVTGLLRLLHGIGFPSRVLLTFSHSRCLLCHPRCGLSSRYSAYVVLRLEETPVKAPLPPRSCLGRSGFSPGLRL
ncbi:hypothetical protein NDU88_004423 [Pleurodeles waltl]|uniref:Uncharacterized protein n=1 Tax=Pleurodeles waltl TaxID=8319 RepID=A0AAV7WU41_PLEWA|nr:hypothetical protein NDU88_004423 [Pleurodeles waltl]